MNILFVSSFLPYPLFSGGHIRLYNLLKELSKNHSITLICEKRDYQTEKDVLEVGRFCRQIEVVPRKKQWTLSNLIKTGFSSQPFIIIGHTLSSMREKIREAMNSNKFDLVHVETFYVMQNLPRLNIPVVLADQNIEHMVYRRYADNAPFFLKHLFYLDVLKIKQWEERFWRRADFVVVTSKDEKKVVKKHNSRVSVVANGVDLSKFRVKGSGLRVQKREKTLLFIGDFRWIENKDAVEWLLSSIWPKLKLASVREGLWLKLWIVGKRIPVSIRELTTDHDVIFDEHAPDDTGQIYQKSDLLLAPIRVGGGGKFKILESLASGLPVVTTTVGIEGIEASAGEEVLIADETDGIVGKIISIFQDERLRKRLIKNGRSLIKEKYDWKIIVGELEKVYLSVVKS